MQIEIGTHLSVVGGKGRFARVSIGLCLDEEADEIPNIPQILLNGRECPRRSQEDDDHVRIAGEGVSEACHKYNWTGGPLLVLKLDLAIVDMHLAATRSAAYNAAETLILMRRNA